MRPTYSATECALAAIVLLPIVALIILVRAVGIVAVVLWQTAIGHWTQ